MGKSLELLAATPANKSGEREFTFHATVNGTSRVFTVRAPDQYEAADRIAPLVSADAAELEQLGVVGSTVSLAFVGLIGYGVYYVIKSMRGFLGSKGDPPSTSRPIGDIRGPMPETNGERRRMDGNQKENIPKGNRSNTTQGRRPASGLSQVVNGPEIEANAVAAGTRSMVSFSTRTWRRYRYNGKPGLIAGEDPQHSFRVVIYSDQNVDRFLSLVRPSVHDMQSGEMRDGIVVMAFPLSSAPTLRANGALEVYLGDNAPANRSFDIVTTSAEDAMKEVQDLLSSSFR